MNVTMCSEVNERFACMLVKKEFGGGGREDKNKKQTRVHMEIKRKRKRFF